MNMETPNLRDIFDALELTAKAEEYASVKNCQDIFFSALDEYFSDNPSGYNQVFDKAFGLASEVQYMGFVQGFTLARSLLMGELYTAPLDALEKQDI